MARKRLPEEDMPPNPDDRFDRLLKLMVERASERPRKEYQTSNEESDEGSSDTQTLKDTSEDAS
jgi:hypothetical protein